MHNLRRFYYANKEKIWKVVLIIAFVLAIIYFVNQNSQKTVSNNEEKELNKQESLYVDKENNTYISDKTLHDENKESPMVVTLLGIVTCVNFVEANAA